MTDQRSIHVAARAVIVEKGRLLLAYDPRTPPCHYYAPGQFFYYLPGGHVHFQESAPHAVLREIQEETGHQGSNPSFLGLLEYGWHFPGDERCCHTHEINLFFKVRAPSLPEEIAMREDHVAFRWAPLSQLSAFDLRPVVLLSLIPRWLAQKNHQDLPSLFE